MPEIWQIAALWAACAVCAAASAALTAFAFALAARKFSADARRKPPESSLGAAARFCCENGGRIAGPLALSARALAAFSAAFAYFAAAASLERLGVETGAGSRILLALAAAAAVALADVFTEATPALPWNIYNICSEHEMADKIEHVQYGMALTLIAIVLLLNSVAIVLRDRLQKKLRG